MRKEQDEFSDASFGQKKQKVVEKSEFEINMEALIGELSEIKAEHGIEDSVSEDQRHDDLVQEISADKMGVDYNHMLLEGGGPAEQVTREVAYNNINQLIDAQYVTVADQDESINHVI